MAKSARFARNCRVVVRQIMLCEGLHPHRLKPVPLPSETLLLYCAFCKCLQKEEGR
jgi:hypothetical protein